MALDPQFKTGSPGAEGFGGGSGGRNFSFGEGFLSSAFSGATTEFLGGQASRDVQRYRAENPVRGAISGIGGFLVPAIGVSLALPWLGLPSAVAKFGTAGAAFSRALTAKTAFAASRPIANRALHFATTAATEEIARLGMSVAAKGLGANVSPGRVAQELPFNIVAAGGIGAGIGAAAKHFSNTARPNIINEGLFQKMFPDDLDVNAPMQVRWRQMIEIRERIANNPQNYPDQEELLRYADDMLSGKRESYQTVLLRQEPLKGVRSYLRKLVANPTYDHRKLIEYFKPRNQKAAKLTGRTVFDPLLEKEVPVKRKKPTPAMDFVVHKLRVSPKDGFPGKMPDGSKGKDYLNSVFRKWELAYNDPNHSKIAYTQFMRYVRNNTSEASGRFAKRFLEPLDGRLSDGTFYGKDEDGFFIMAKQITKKTSKDASTEFLIFKTDNLGVFDPKLKAYANNITDLYRIEVDKGWIIDPDFDGTLNPSQTTKALREKQAARRAFVRDENPNVEIVERIRAEGYHGPLEKLIPLGRDRKRIWDTFKNDDPMFGLPKSERVKALRDKLPVNMRFQAGKLLQNFSGYARDYLMSSLHRYADFAQAAGLARKFSALFDSAEARAIMDLAGSPATFKEGDNALLRMFGKPAGAEENSIFGLIDRLTTDQADKLNYLIFENADDLAKILEEEGDIFRRAWKAISALDTQNIQDMYLVNALAGETDFVALESHMAMSRTWPGKLRVPVKGPSGGIVGFGGGDSAKEAIAAAKELAEDAAREMKDLMLAEGLEPAAADLRFTSMNSDIVMAGRLGDSSTLLSMRELGGKAIEQDAFNRAIRAAHKKAPQTFKKRRGLLGYQKKFTKQEMKDKLLQQNRTIKTLQAYRLGLSYGAEELADLARMRPDMHRRLINEIERTAGVPGKWTKATNEAVDRFVGKVMPGVGANSATNIVRAMNNVTYTLTLTAMDVGFAAINAVTGLQTVLSEVALVGTAVPERMMGLYSTGVHFSKGQARPYHWLDPIKLSAKGFRRLKNMTPEFADALNWSMRQGTTKPRWVENYIGEINEHLGVKDVLKGEIGFGEYLQNLNRWLPSKSEEFARIHSFSTGYTVGEEIWGLQGEELWQYAANFVDRTMFVYNEARRPTILTGPFGSFYGLFKNWMFSYLGNMNQHLGEGFARGNWTPFLWSMAGTGSLTGLGGVPLFFVADSFSKFAADKELRELLYENAGYDAGGLVSGKALDALYYGLPAFLPLALSVQSRGAVPGADVVRDVSTLFDIAALDRFSHLGDAFGEALSSITTSQQHPAHNSLFWKKFARATLPRTGYRAMQVIGTRGLNSLTTGNQLISELTFPEQVAHSLGITPLKIQKYYDVSSAEYKKELKKREGITAHGRYAAEQMRNGDFSGLADTVMLGFYQGLSPSSILRSANTFYNKQQGDAIDRQFGYPIMQRKREMGLSD